MIYSTIVISLLFRDSSEPVEPLHGRPDVHEYDHVPPRVVEGGALEGALGRRVEAGQGGVRLQEEDGLLLAGGGRQGGQLVQVQAGDGGWRRVVGAYLQYRKQEF